MHGIAMTLVAARMIHPSSERESLRWLETNSTTLEFLRLDIGQAIKLDKLYRLSDLLVNLNSAVGAKSNLSNPLMLNR